MNWREFTGLAAATADSRAEPNATAINRALNKQALAHAAHCWQRFSRACNAVDADAELTQDADFY